MSMKIAADLEQQAGHATLKEIAQAVYTLA
jgi:hypothetical protein